MAPSTSRSPTPSALLLGCACLLAACTFDSAPAPTDVYGSSGGTGGFVKPDVTRTDGGSDTAAPSDLPDTGQDTAGAPDAGTADAGTLDAGTLDTGTLDTGTLDTGTLDTGTLDTGTLDTGTLDIGAGEPDSGADLTGAPDAPDTADAGKSGCKAADPKTCDDGDPCSQDVCDEPTGECAHVPLPSGTPCDAGLLCRVSVCRPHKGCIAAGDPKKCDDGKPCTVDECIEGKGCKSKVGGTAPCDDGDPCTAYDKCDGAGTCKGEADHCDDGWPCTQDTCDPAAGCKHVLQVGGPCDDGNACTDKTECVNGDCKGAAVPCDDGNACTEEACDPSKGCAHKLLDKIPCDDGNACTFATSCEGGTCSGKKIDCDDGVSCTADSCDSDKGCANTLKKKGSPCTNGGTCDDKGVCSGLLNCGNGKVEKGESCDDGNKNPCDACNNTCSGSGSGTKLSGTATVGTGGEYKGIAETIAAVQTCGVAGPTRFVVLAGTYKTPGGTTFPAVAAASPTAPITWQAAKGAKVKLSGASTGSSYTGIIRIASGAHDLVIDGFDLDGSDAANRITGQYSGPVLFLNGAAQKRITVRNLHIHDFGPSAWSKSYYGYTGAINVYSTSSTQQYEDIHLEGNRIENIIPVRKYTYQGGILLTRGRHKGLQIVGNTITGVQMSAICLYHLYGLRDWLVANNIITIEYNAGVYMYYGSGLENDARIVFNTFVFTGSGSYVLYVRYAKGNGKLIYRHNIFASLIGGRKSDYIYHAFGLSNPGNNCLFNVSTSYGGGDIEGNPDFKSTGYPYDFHLNKTSPCADKASLDIPGITTDIDGDVRIPPADIGADEIK